MSTHSAASKYGNVYIDALASQSWIEAGRTAGLTFAFSDAYLSWTEPQRQEVRAALASVSAVCGLTFSEVAEAASPDMIEHRVTLDQLIGAIGDDYFAGVKGWHTSPADVAGTSAPVQGYYDTAGLTPNHAGWLVLHELLHGVGLEHPHSTWHGSGLFPGVIDSQDPGDFGLNSTLTTVMSYRAFEGFAARVDGPMAFDIATLQMLYGARAANEGNTTYTVARDALSCVWDTGGIDWFVGAGASVIDLRSATLQADPLGGGALSRAQGFSGGLTIAFGVTIENARGGAGNNMIVGNTASNVLIGEGGNDTILGGAGGDRITGGANSDVLSGGSTLTAAAVDGARDVFLYAAAYQSSMSAPDQIFGFERGRDVIDLSAMTGTQRIQLTTTNNVSHLYVDAAGTAPGYEMHIIVHGSLAAGDIIL